jgi:hypothetical protein
MAGAGTLIADVGGGFCGHRAARERFAQGGVEILRAVALQQFQQPRRVMADRISAQCDRTKKRIGMSAHGF